MPTLDWLNRAHAFTTAAQVPSRLPVVFEETAGHTPGQPLYRCKPGLDPFHRETMEAAFGQSNLRFQMDHEASTP